MHTLLKKNPFDTVYLTKKPSHSQKKKKNQFQNKGVTIWRLRQNGLSVKENENEHRVWLGNAGKATVLGPKNTNSIKIPTAYLCLKEMGIINKIQRFPVCVQNFSGKRHRHSWKAKPTGKKAKVHFGNMKIENTYMKQLY